MAIRWLNKLILSSLPGTFATDGLDILRAICRPHYGATALKVKIQQATGRVTGLHQHPIAIAIECGQSQSTSTRT